MEQTERQFLHQLVPELRAGLRRKLLSQLVRYLEIMSDYFPTSFMEIELLEQLISKLIELKKKRLGELSGQYCVEKNVIPQIQIGYKGYGKINYCDSRLEARKQFLEVVGGWGNYEDCIDLYDLQIVLQPKHCDMKNQEKLETKNCESLVQESTFQIFLNKEAVKKRKKIHERIVPYFLLVNLQFEVSSEEIQQLYPRFSGFNRQESESKKDESAKKGFFQGLKGWLCSVPAMLGDSIKTERMENDLDEETLLSSVQKSNTSIRPRMNKRETSSLKSKFQ